MQLRKNCKADSGGISFPSNVDAMATVASSTPGCGGGGSSGSASRSVTDGRTTRLNAFLQQLLGSKLGAASVGAVAAFVDLDRMGAGGNGAGVFTPLVPLEPGAYDPRKSATSSSASAAAPAPWPGGFSSGAGAGAAGPGGGSRIAGPSASMFSLQIGRSAMMPTGGNEGMLQHDALQPPPPPPPLPYGRSSPQRGAFQRRHARSVSNDEVVKAESLDRSSKQRRRAPSDEGASAAPDDAFDDAGAIDFFFGEGEVSPSALDAPSASGAQASGGAEPAVAAANFEPIDLLQMQLGGAGDSGEMADGMFGMFLRQ